MSDVSPRTDHSLSVAAGLQPLTLPGKNVVAIGGGTGLSRLLSGLKHYCFESRSEALTEKQKQCLTAVVTVSDDGGSSRILRKAYSILAPGDIRNCLLALAGGNVTMTNLFGFRFNGALNDHSLGNLILTALTQLQSDFNRAIEIAAEILDVRGVVLPATLDNVSIKAQCSDGSVVYGESNIRQAGKSIDRITLLPESGLVAQAAVTEAIRKADLIILGPGSLYTSIIPPLIVPGTAEAIAASKACKLLVMNLMTEPGETDGYRTVDFLQALKRHAPAVNLDYVLLNDITPDPQLVSKYRSCGSKPVPQESESFSEFGCIPVFDDLASMEETISHDSAKLAAAIAALYSKLPACRQVSS